jgi:hypothetical protein
MLFVRNFEVLTHLIAGFSTLRDNSLSGVRQPGRCAVFRVAGTRPLTAGCAARRIVIATDNGSVNRQAI